MSLEVLKQHIKKGEFANLYIIYGEDDYLKDFYCKKLIQKAVGGLEDFNLQKFSGNSLDLAQVAAAVNNLPLMSEHKCVLLKDVEPDGLHAGDWKELQGIIKTIPPECILVFHFDSAKPSAKKDKRFQSLLKNAQKSGLAVEIAKPTRRDAQKFIEKWVKASGCEIDDEISGILADTCGTDLNALACEADKLCALAGGGKITREQIEEIVIKPVTSSIYDLAKAVVAGRLNTAMNILGELFYKKEEPVIILSALSGAFCDLYRARAAAMSGAGESRVVADFNYRGREFRVRNAMRDCRGVDISYFGRCLTLLMQADVRIKGSRTDNRIILEELLVEIGQAER